MSDRPAEDRILHAPRPLPLGCTRRRFRRPLAHFANPPCQNLPRKAPRVCAVRRSRPGKKTASPLPPVGTAANAHSTRPASPSSPASPGTSPISPAAALPPPDPHPSDPSSALSDRPDWQIPLWRVDFIFACQESRSSGGVLMGGGVFAGSTRSRGIEK